MQAARIHRFGSPNELVLDDLPRPTPGAGEIAIEIRASGINPIDLKVRRGDLADMLSQALPMTLGWELAGTVTAVGADVAGFGIGDAVFAMEGLPRSGTHADAMVLAARQAAPKPRQLGFEQAAVVPATALAAFTARDAAKLVPGERVLVQGAGGAVGHWLVQLLKQAGIETVATASAGDLDRVSTLGAGRVVDYRHPHLLNEIGQVDVVIDLVGGAAQTRAWDLLGPHGRMVSSVPPSPAPAGRQALFFQTQPDGALLGRIGRMIDDGLLAPLPVAAVRPLGDIARVHAEIESGQLRGKIVLVP